MDTYRMYKHLGCYPNKDFFFVPCRLLLFRSIFQSSLHGSIQNCIEFQPQKPIGNSFKSKELNFIYNIISTLTKTQILITSKDCGSPNNSLLADGLDESIGQLQQISALQLMNCKYRHKSNEFGMIVIHTMASLRDFTDLPTMNKEE